MIGANKPLSVDTAMVLSAGLGTRMAALNGKLPKPLIRLNGKPLIDHVLDRLAQVGVRRAVVNVHHHADLIEHHLKGRRSPRITFSDERAHLLDTGGGVKKALPRLGPRPFLIHNADSVWIESVGSNLARLIAAWDEERMDCLLLLAPQSISQGYLGRGDFALEPDGRIRRRGEQEVVPFVFAGVSMAHPRLFAPSPEGPFSLNLLWSRSIAAGRAWGMRMEGVWMHVGTPEALAQAEQCLNDAAR
jgi:N-acetyl-alpha-D-muramate 1-phosphate uridylyltransferase